MNDFTRQELLILHEFLDTACDLYDEPESTYILAYKIRLMIENYCEHQKDSKIEWPCHHESNGKPAGQVIRIEQKGFSDPYFYFECKKCGIYFRE